MHHSQRLAGLARHGASLIVALTLSASLSGCGDSSPVASDPSPPPSTNTADAAEAASEEAAWRSVRQICAHCHAAPPPDVLPRGRWPYVIDYMNRVIAQYELATPLTAEQVAMVTRYYVEHSPAALPELTIESTPSPLAFDLRGFADPPDRRQPNPPFIANVNITDLDADGTADVLICDVRANRVSWVQRQGDSWREIGLLSVIAPAKTTVVDVDGDGDLDIAVAVLGTEMPNDEKVGGAILLINQGFSRNGEPRFAQQQILSGVPRVADLEPADFDGDGDIDFAVGVFGGWVTGHVAWLEQREDGSFEQHIVYPKNGAVHVPTVDLDGDGRMDFIALVTQAHEEVVAFYNLGDGRFEPRVLWQAGNPLYGSSGIELVDLDEDGDLDILYTNGDALDIETSPKPYHGIQWLENRGNFELVYHDIARLYGAYRAVARDLDGDGDLDVVASSQYNRWDQPGRQSLIWLENDGAQNFAPHTLSTNPTHLVTIDIGDLDGDGKPDILGGGMHISPPFDRVGRVTAWWNQGAR